MAPSYTEKLSQQLAFIGQYNPASVAASTVLTASIDMAKYRRLLFIIQCGVLGASATIDAKVQQAATSGGSYTDLSPTKAITQLVKASNDNSVVLIDLAAEELTQGQRFVKLSVTVGTAASIFGVVVLGSDGRYHPQGDNLAAVVQTV